MRHANGPAFLLLLSALCQSCLYSTTFKPPAADPPSTPPTPLSLTVSLDGLEVYEDGKQHKPGHGDWDRLHRGFNEALRRAQVFNVLEPRSPQANLHVDEAFHMQTTGGTMATAFAYGFFLAPLILPVPFPLHAECTHALAFRAQLADGPITVRQYRDRYTWKVLAATVWTPYVRQDELAETLADHHGRVLADRLRADYGFFAELAPVLLAGDQSAVRALVARASAPAS